MEAFVCLKCFASIWAVSRSLNKIIVLYFLTVLFVFSAYAQNPSSHDDPTLGEFLELNQDFFRLIDGGEGKIFQFSYQASSSRRFRDEQDASFRNQRLSLGGEILVPTSENFFWRAGVNYELQFLNFKNIELGGSSFDTEQLHRAEISGGFGYFLNRNLLFTTLLTPGLHSNLSSIDSDHFQLFTQNFFVYRLTDNFEIIAGAVSTELFDEVALFPVIGLRAQALDDRLHIKLTPPVELRLAYYLSEKAQIYTGFWLTGDQFRVESLGQEFQIQQQDRRVGVGAIRWLSDNINLQLEVGAMVNSKLQFELIESPVSNDRLRESFYFNLTLGYTL